MNKTSIKKNPMLRIKEVLASSRPLSWINTAAPFFVGYLLAHGSINIASIIGVIYFSFFYNFLMYGVVDIYGDELNIKNPHKNSIEGAVANKRKHQHMFYFILGSNLSIVLYLLLTGTLASGALLVIVIFLALGYSMKPFRFKEVPILDSIISSLHFVMPFVFGLVYGGAQSLPWPAIIAFLMWGIASHSLGAIKNIKPDRAGKISSIATKLGAKFTNTYSLIFYLLSCLVVVIFYFPWGLAAGIILSPYVFNVAFFRKYKSDAKSDEYRRAWKNFIWLNLICGAWLTLLLLFIFDPFGLGMQRVGWLGGFLIVFAIVQFALTYYNYKKIARPKTKRLGELPNINILLHSIGNQDDIASTLLALIGQNYPHFDIYYANLDHNPQSYKIAEGYQDSRLHIIRVDKTPSGWTQQAWATHTLLGKANSELVVLLGADTILLPNTLSVIASLFDSQGLDLVSLLPADQNKSFWQQLVMSQEQYLLMGLCPPPYLTQNFPNLATAYSSLLAFKKSAIKKIGGFEIVRLSPLEDLDIANKARRKGLNTQFYAASELAISQNRSSFRELYKYNKQRLYPSLHFNMPLSLALISGGLLVVTFPPILLVSLLLLGAYEGTFLLAIGCGLMLCDRLYVMIRSRQSIIGGLLYPIGTMIMLLAVISSMANYELKKPHWESRLDISS